MRTRRRSWKKRVAEYVCSLPSVDKYDELGIVCPVEDIPAHKEVTDPKRQRLEPQERGTPKSPSHQRVQEVPGGIIQRTHQPLAPKPSNDSVASSHLTSSLASSSSDDRAVRQWLDSIDTSDIGRPEDGPAQKPPSAEAVESKEKKGVKLLRSGSSEDDLLLGAEAHHLQPQDLGAVGAVGVSKPEPSPKENQQLSNGEILAFAQRGSETNKRSQLKLMAERYNSMTSDLSEMTTTTTISSVDELLQARNDPEELLRNLGFGGVTETDTSSRIPERFLKAPSSAKGINVQEFLEYEHQKEENRAAAVGGYLGIEGTGVFRKGGAGVVNKIATMSSIINMLKKNVSQSSEEKQAGIASLFAKPATPKPRETQTDTKNSSSKVEPETKSPSKGLFSSLAGSKSPGFKSLVSMASRNDSPKQKVGNQDGTLPSPDCVTMETRAQKNLIREVIVEEKDAEFDIQKADESCSVTATKVEDGDVLKSAVDVKVDNPEATSIPKRHSDSDTKNENVTSPTGDNVTEELSHAQCVDEDDADGEILERTLTEEEHIDLNLMQDNDISQDTQKSSVTMEMNPHDLCPVTTSNVGAMQHEGDSHTENSIATDSHTREPAGKTIAVHEPGTTDSEVTDTVASETKFTSCDTLGNTISGTKESECVSKSAKEQGLLLDSNLPKSITEGTILNDDIAVAEDKGEPVSMATRTVEMVSMDTELSNMDVVLNEQIDEHLLFDNQVGIGHGNNVVEEELVSLKTDVLKNANVSSCLDDEDIETRLDLKKDAPGGTVSEFEGIASVMVKDTDHIGGGHLDGTPDIQKNKSLHSVCHDTVIPSREPQYCEKMSEFSHGDTGDDISQETGTLRAPHDDLFQEGASEKSQENPMCRDFEFSPVDKTIFGGKSHDSDRTFDNIYSEVKTPEGGCQLMDEKDKVTHGLEEEEEEAFYDADIENARELLEKVQKHVQMASEKFSVQKANVTQYAPHTVPSATVSAQMTDPDCRPGDAAERQLRMEKCQGDGNLDSLTYTTKLLEADFQLQMPSPPEEDKISPVQSERRKPLQISSTDHNIDEFAYGTSAARKSPETSKRGTLSRMGSAQSDSSGFADDTHIDPSSVQTTEATPPLYQLDATSDNGNTVDPSRLHARTLQQHKKSSTESSASDITIATEFERKLSATPSVDMQDDVQGRACEVTSMSPEVKGQEVTDTEHDDLSAKSAVTPTAVRVSLTEPRPAEEVENFLDTLQRTIEDVTGTSHIVCGRKPERRVRTERYLYRSRSGSEGHGDYMRSLMRALSDDDEEEEEEERKTPPKPRQQRPPLRRTTSATVMIENGKPKTEVRQRGRLRKAHSVDEERDRDREKVIGHLKVRDGMGNHPGQLETAHENVDAASGGEYKQDSGLVDKPAESPLESSRVSDVKDSETQTARQRILIESSTQVMDDSGISETIKHTRQTQTDSPENRNSTMILSPEMAHLKKKSFGKLDISPILQTSTTSETGQSFSDSSFINGKKINIGTESVTRSMDIDSDAVSVSAGHSVASEDGSLIDKVTRMSSPADRSFHHGREKFQWRRTPSWAEEANIETHPVHNESPHDIFFDSASSMSGSFSRMTPHSSILEDEDVFPLREEEFVRVMRAGREVWMSKAEYGRLRDELLLKALIQQPNPLYAGHKIGLQLPPMIFREEPTSWDALSGTEGAMKEVRYLQQGVQKYKSDLVALETLSSQQYHAVYDHLTEEERDDWEGLKTLRLQIIEEIYEMEKLLSARAKAINEDKQRRYSHNDDTNMSEHTIQSLDMIKQMIDLLKEQINQRSLLHNIQMHTTLSSSHHSGISSPLSEYSLDSSVPRLIERDDLLQELMSMKRELEWQRSMERKEREKSMREMKTVIIEEITYNITKETENLKIELQDKKHNTKTVTQHWDIRLVIEYRSKVKVVPRQQSLAKDEELKHLRKQLDEHNRRRQLPSSANNETEEEKSQSFENDADGEVT
ncbi:uncharacterized protein [Ptychodera flava]|uniref:uncharacterized protein isoform X2 n=1 Tax=Ptychodera flava TaxID=63121 RepID=UPI00396A6589